MKLYFAGNFGNNAERMNWAAHQVTRRIINHAMAGYGVFSGKDAGNDFQLVMAAALARPGMAGMAR